MVLAGAHFLPHDDSQMGEEVGTMSATKNVKQYSGPPVHTPLAPENWPDPILDTDDNIQGDAIDKVNAGARLFFAMYHHPQAREFFSSQYMTPGLMRAYMAASKAWGL